MHKNDPTNCEDGQKVQPGKYKQFAETLSRRLQRDVICLAFLILINSLYLYIGGMVFYMLENKKMKNMDTRQEIARFVDALKNTSVGYKVSQVSLSGNRLASRLSPNDVKAIDNLMNEMLHQRKEAGTQIWTLTNSVFFAATIVTTVGFGNLAPSTEGGRAFCVIYALIGIPLTLLLLTNIGKILAKYINEIWGLILQQKRRIFDKETKYTSINDDDQDRAPLWLACLFLTLVLVSDAVTLMYVEGWSFRVSLYYLFITLTTIGLGDIVPKNEKVVWFNVIFLYLGLAAVSITLSLFITNMRIQTKRINDYFICITNNNREKYGSDVENEMTPLTEQADEKHDEDTR